MPLGGLQHARRARIVERAFVADERHAMREAADDRLNRERQPTDVGGAPIDVVRRGADLPLHIRPCPNEKSRRAMDDALRLVLGARGEDQERGIVGLDLFAGALGRLRIQRGAPIAFVRLQRRRLAGSVDDERVAQPVHAGARLAHIGEQGDFAASAKGSVGGDGDDSARALQAQPYRIGREAAEQHGVDRADAVAGLNGDKRLRQIGQMDGDDVATLHAERLQRVGAAAHFLAQLRVVELAHIAGLALPDNRRLVGAPGILRMAIDAIVGDVEMSAHVIAKISETALAQGVPGALPAHALGRPGPIGVRSAGALGLSRFGQQRRLARHAPLLGQRDQRRQRQRFNSVHLFLPENCALDGLRAPAHRPAA